MKKILNIILILLLTLSITGCKKVQETFVEHDNYYSYQNVSYGKHERNILDLNLPKTPTNGLILFIHGGSWVSGDKDGYRGSMEDWTKNMGYATCSINYRYISGKFDCYDMLEDIDNALKKVKKYASLKGLDLTKVLLTGHSAGGHLSLLYAYKMKDQAPIKPVCVVNNCGPTDINDDNYYIGNELSIKLVYLFSNLINKKVTVNNREDRYDDLKKVSPIYYINEDTVPTLTAHGMNDSIVPYSNAVTLHNKLNEYGVENLLIPFPNSDHGLESDEECHQLLNDKMLEYVNKYLK